MNELIEARRAFYGDKPIEVRMRTFEVRSWMDEETGTPCLGLSGYASTTEEPYAVRDWLGEYQETICAGAFTKALQERDDVRLLINHEGIPLARTKSGTMTLAEDNQGLRVDVPNLDGNSPLVQSIRSAMERGDVDEMSFAFKATRQEWNEDYTERFVREVKLYDVSVVSYPANPGTSVKLRDGRDAFKSARAVSDAKWNPHEGDYTPEQWHRACLIHGDPADDKSLQKLPVREPSGTINRNGVHAAAGRIHEVDAPHAEKASAARALINIYESVLHETPPSALHDIAGRAADTAPPADTTAATERRLAQLRAVAASL